MSASHFSKQLPYCYALSRRLIHPSPSSFSVFSPLLLTTCRRTTHPSTPYSFFTNSSVPPPFSSSSYSSYTTLTEPVTSAYLSVRIQCPKHVAGMFSEALLCFGASSASVDEDDNCRGSDEICIDSVFPVCQEVSVCISQAADSVGLKDIPSYEVKLGEQFDWIQKTQESFQPVEVTEGLWIVPEWRMPLNPHATNIILNPGLAFGTGEHPTTMLCLLLLQGLIKGGEFFLDYGTGSGILAIAAVKFGGVLSVGVDIDPQAITSARHNAVLNKIEPERLQLHLVSSEASHSSTNEHTHGLEREQSSCGTKIMSEKEKYDVVIANLLLNPLLELADHIVSYAKPGGVVGLSGILSEQLPYIIDRYSQFLDNISVSEMDDWACVSGTKKGNVTDS